MRFFTRDPYERPSGSSTPGAYLEANGWNDYGFVTLWTLYVVADRTVHEIGGVKIGDRLESPEPPVPSEFDTLPAQFFSLGQDEDYYDQLNELGAKTREEVLRGLHDVALDLGLFREVRSLGVTKESLLRWVKPVAVQTQLHRIALGGARLSPYAFSYRSSPVDRYGRATPPFLFDFTVDPTTVPRTNVHVLIGRNGVGKSYMLNDIATALTRQESAGEVSFTQQGDARLTQQFANVVSVAYSAFDAFEPRRQSNAAGALRHTYIGLKKIAAAGERSAGLKDHSALAQEFGKSLSACVEARRLDRWRHVLGFLASDPLFAEAVDRIMASDAAPDRTRAAARQIFAELSSGHKIVLLILTRLVETMEEATLVLIDEPESHLHPPLLSAFMSALTELLEDRNGVAIIATHSPVVLQEVPGDCVWKLLGSGGVLTADRPSIETYGENVGTLTQEVFGLEVTASGFHRALAEAVRDDGSADYAELLDMFGGKLGAEARALLQSMLYFARR